MREKPVGLLGNWYGTCTGGDGNGGKTLATRVREQNVRNGHLSGESGQKVGSATGKQKRKERVEYIASEISVHALRDEVGELKKCAPLERALA